MQAKGVPESTEAQVHGGRAVKTNWGALPSWLVT
jgi:hypothetical protein